MEKVFKNVIQWNLNKAKNAKTEEDRLRYLANAAALQEQLHDASN